METAHGFAAPAVSALARGIREYSLFQAVLLVMDRLRQEHPGLGDEALYDTQMRRLCRAAKETDTPLEINLLGLREGRHYPNERFWRIAGEEGNAVILGFDAHEPEQLLDPAYEREALRLAHRCGIEPIEKLTIRRI